MLTLYIDPECAACRRLRGKLAGYHLAHQVEEVTDPAPDGREPHTLIDSGECVEGHEAIDEHIEEMWDFLQLARHQSDLCHDCGDDDAPDRCGR